MRFITCERCNGTGKITVERPATLTRMETVEEECDVCGGTGKLMEDDNAVIHEKLDRIIALLEERNKPRRWLFFWRH